MIKKSLYFLYLFLQSILIIAPYAAKAEITSSLDATATVIGQCKIDTSPLTFGELDVLQITNSGAGGVGIISLACPLNTRVKVGIGSSKGGGDYVSGDRILDSDRSSIPYQIFRDVQMNDIFGNTTNADILTVDSTLEVSVYGRIFKQTTLPGRYTDNLVVTVEIQT